MRPKGWKQMPNKEPTDYASNIFGYNWLYLHHTFLYMIAIGSTLLSNEIIEEQFVCDLTKCKGGCCQDGDAGAPLHSSELAGMERAVQTIWENMYPEGQDIVTKKGFYEYDEEFGPVTPLLANALCVYAHKEKNGMIKCLFEQAFNEGKLTWKKPISCHLYPIRVKTTKHGDLLNYEPREDMCQGGCDLGKKLKVPAYEFLKEPLIRKYGQDFYDDLNATAIHLKGQKI
jgi:hypothetical protein